MYKFINPKLALKLIDEIIISKRFPYYVNLDSDEYSEDEADTVLTEVLQSPIIKVDEIPLVSTDRHPNGEVLLSAKVVDWDAYNELKESIK